MNRDALHDALNELLKPKLFKDYCPNGLQVQGKSEIKKVITGVTASQALIERAIEAQADAILVHHGYFWKNEPAVVTGMKHQRLKTLLEHDINLFAYHLPLDAHPQLGNNAQLAKVLGICCAQAVSDRPTELMWQGELAQTMDEDDFAELLLNELDFKPTVVSANKPIKTVAWCTGGAQSMITEAARLGVDAYISGEISESTAHAAVELGVHYFAAGHHATERFGVKALGDYLIEHYALDVAFIDLPIPV